MGFVHMVISESWPGGSPGVRDGTSQEERPKSGAPPRRVRDSRQSDRYGKGVLQEMNVEGPWESHHGGC